MRSRAAAAALLLLVPGSAAAWPHKGDYPPPPADWGYYNLGGGPYLTTCYPFAGYPGYRGAFGGFWAHGAGPHRPAVPVYAPLPDTFENPDHTHLPNRRTVGFGLGTSGWVGPFRASPRHLPVTVSVRPAHGGPSAGPAPAAACATCLTVRVTVPAGAELLVDGVKTAQTGAARVFESPPVEAGRDVRYALVARWTENGAAVERTRTVTGKPGETVRVDFTAAGGE